MRLGGCFQVNLKSVGGQDSDGELLELESEVEETPPPVLLWQAEKDRQQTDSLASWVVQFCGLGLSNLQVIFFGTEGECPAALLDFQPVSGGSWVMQVEDGLPGPYTGVKVVL